MYWYEASQRDIERTDHWSVATIVDLLWSSCKEDEPPTLDRDMQFFCNDLETLLEPIRIYDRDVNATANEPIMSRLIAFTKKDPGEWSFFT